MTLRIRDAVAADAATIADFNVRLVAETENRTLDRPLVDDGVAALLADPAKGRYWVAEYDGRIVGQIMVTYEWSDWRNGMLWWIQSVYVDPALRRQGVFSSLSRHVESLARKEAAGLRLYFDRDNLRAQEIYRALGMVEPGYLMMESVFGAADQQNED